MSSWGRTARIGLTADFTTLIAHLDNDDDLGFEPATNSLIYSCSCLLAHATAEQQAVARVGADDLPAAAAATLQQHTHHPGGRQQRRQQLSETAVLTPGQSDPTGLTVAEVFNLSSRPQAKYKLVLDFDGNTLEGSAWNDLKNLRKIETPPYDKDNDTSTFNAEEMADIVAVWRAVAEDFAPFDVDVTTADPGSAALNGTGQKIIIGGASGDWYGVAGGIAYVNSFGRLNLPCFVFPKTLGPNNPKYVWEAVSHELGHTLGLLHDGVLPNPAMPSGIPYFEGQGDWAPLMGIPYHAEVTTWDAGEYPFSNNNQDDLAIIGNRLPRVPAQYGTNISTATHLTATLASPDAVNATVNATSVLSTRGQHDVFSFGAAAGPASITVAGTPPFRVGQYNRANLNAAAMLHDASGVVLATFGSQNMGIDAAEVTIPSSGVFYVSVSGRGEGTPAAGGYSSYALLGRYTLSVTFQNGFKPPVVNCRGAWGSWSGCSASCNQSMAYRVSQPAAFGGRACPAANGSLRMQPCSGGSCVPAINDPVMVITSINVTRELLLLPNDSNITAWSEASSPLQQFSFCRAVVTLRTRAGARLAKAHVSGAWSDSGMRNNGSAAASATSGTRNSGQAVFRSRSWRADQQPGQQSKQLGLVTACVFSVSSVESLVRHLTRRIQ